MRAPILALTAAELAGVGYGVAARLAFEGADTPFDFGAMTLAFVVLVPLVVGFLTVALTPDGDRMPPPVGLTLITCVACLGFVLAAFRPGCLFLTTFHTFPSEHTVVKTQSLIEKKG